MVPYSSQVAGGLGRGLRPFSGPVVDKKTGTQIDKTPWFRCSACGELFGTAGTRNSHMQNLCRVVAKWRNQQVIDCDAGDFMLNGQKGIYKKAKKEEVKEEPKTVVEAQKEERAKEGAEIIRGKERERPKESEKWREKERDIGKEKKKEKETEAEKAREKPREKEKEKETAKETVKEIERKKGKAIEKATEKATEKMIEKATEKATEKVIEKATEKATEKVIEKATGKAREKEQEKMRKQSTPERDMEVESDEGKSSERLQSGNRASKEKLSGAGIQVRKRRRITFLKLIMRRSGAGGKYQKRKSPSSQNLVRLVASVSDGDDPTPPPSTYKNRTGVFGHPYISMDHPLPPLPPVPAALDDSKSDADPFNWLTKLFCQQIRLAGHTVALIDVLEVPTRCCKSTGLVKVYREDSGFRPGILLYEQDLGQDPSMFRRLPTESRCVGTLMMAKRYSEELGGLGIRVRVLIVLQRPRWAESKQVRVDMLAERAPDVDIVRRSLVRKEESTVG